MVLHRKRVEETPALYSVSFAGLIEGNKGYKTKGHKILVLHCNSSEFYLGILTLSKRRRKIMLKKCLECVLLKIRI